MAKKEYKLPEITPGMYMSWNLSAQASRAHNISLKDTSGNVYFSYVKDHISTDPAFRFLGQGHCDVKGELILTDECNEASELKASIGANTITDNSGVTVGHSYEFCIEDWEDEDYNDIYVNVVAWNKKG